MYRFKAFCFKTDANLQLNNKVDKLATIVFRTRAGHSLDAFDGERLNDIALIISFIAALDLFVYYGR